MTRHVLVIDDNPEDREAIVAALRGDTTARHTFKLVSTASEGLAALREGAEQFDLVVLDYRLPDMNAEQFLSKLGVPNEVPPVPIVLLTGSLTPDSVSTVVTRGVQDFFSKSAVRTDILSRIATNAILRHGLIVDLVQSERRAEDARVQAEQANRAKSHFLTTISHELRTPLTAILGFTELLRRELGDSLNPERAEMLEMVIQSGNHLAELLNDLIDIAKVEAGTLNVELQPSNLGDLVHSTCDLMGLRAAEHELKLTWSVDSSVPETIQIDPVRVRQILVNLLGNAIKYTDKGEIECRAGYDTSNEQLCLQVIDTGCGIDETLQSTLFEPFVQGPQPGGKERSGIGLGLAICHRLSAMMGGSLALEETSPKGTTFTLRIPAPECRPNASAYDESPVPAWAREPSGDLDLTNRRVLLAEDTRANQMLITKLLNKQGAEVDLATNGVDAIERVKQAKDGDAYDLILMDIQMPVMDGLEATRQLRSQGYRMPIVAITAAALKGDSDRCLNAGCDEVITKPIDIDDMNRILARTLDGHGR